MGEVEIAQFLSTLAEQRHVSASTQNQALNALLFLYKEILEKKIGLIQGVVRAKRPSRLPVVLTKDEVKRVLNYLSGDSWLMAMLLSQLTCWRVVMTFEPFKSCSGIRTSRLAWCILTFLNRGGKGVLGPADSLLR